MLDGAPATFWRLRSSAARGIVGATALLALASIALCCWTKPALLIATGCIPCGAGACVAAYALLRSVRLSAIAGLTTAGAVALSFGLLTACGWLSTAMHGGVFHSVLKTGRPTAAIFVEGLIVAALVLWQLRIAAAEISMGATPDAAAWTARDRTLPPGSAALVLVIVSMEASALAAIVSALVAMWFCFVVFPRIVAESPVSEKAIVRFNRAQEFFQRAIALAEFLLEPRWALSATGIAAVLFSLISLDRVPAPGGRVVFAALELWNAPLIVFYGTGFATFIVAVVWTRSWQKALGIAVAAIFAGTFAGWFMLRTGLDTNVFARLFSSTSIATTGSTVVACLLFLVGSVLPDEVRDALDAQRAVMTALTNSAGAVVYIALAALLAAALALSAPAIILSIASVLAALVLLPCFYVALNALFQRYRSPEEMFGRE